MSNSQSSPQTHANPTCREAVQNCVAYHDDGDGTSRGQILKTAYTFDKDDIDLAITSLLLLDELERTETGNLRLTD